MNIYCEKQRGDMCRMHSLNNYFGYSKFSEEDFFRYCDEYDSLIEGLKSREMDGFSEGRSIVSYIIDKFDKKTVILIPLNNYNNSRNHLDMDFFNKIKKNTSTFFEFNKNHIWVNLKINNKYFKIDSISGVHEIDNRDFRDNGYLLVIEENNKIKVIKQLIKEIKDHITKIDKNNLIELEEKYDIIFFNLYYCLKHYNSDIKSMNYKKSIMSDSKLIEYYIAINNIKQILKEFVLCTRQNNYSKRKTKLKYFNIILNIIKFNFD